MFATASMDKSIKIWKPVDDNIGKHIRIHDPKFSVKI